MPLRRGSPPDLHTYCYHDAPMALPRRAVLCCKMQSEACGRCGSLWPLWSQASRALVLGTQRCCFAHGRSRAHTAYAFRHGPLNDKLPLFYDQSREGLVPALCGRHPGLNRH